MYNSDDVDLNTKLCSRRDCIMFIAAYRPGSSEEDCDHDAFYSGSVSEHVSPGEAQVYILVTTDSTTRYGKRARTIRRAVLIRSVRERTTCLKILMAHCECHTCADVQRVLRENSMDIVFHSSLLWLC